MTPEGWTKDDIKKGLKAHGIPYSMPVQTGYGKRMVDFYCTLPPDGRALLIEAKRSNGKGRVTAIQNKILADNRLAGGISVVAECWFDVARAIGK